jgi:hypothetical protein
MSTASSSSSSLDDRATTTGDGNAKTASRLNEYPDVAAAVADS